MNEAPTADENQDSDRNFHRQQGSSFIDLMFVDVRHLQVTAAGDLMKLDP